MVMTHALKREAVLDIMLAMLRSTIPNLLYKPTWLGWSVEMEYDILRQIDIVAVAHRTYPKKPGPEFLPLQPIGRMHCATSFLVIPDEGMPANDELLPMITELAHCIDAVFSDPHDAWDAFEFIESLT